MKKSAILLLAALFLGSCAGDDANLEVLAGNAGIVGTWVEAVVDQEVSLYARSGDFDPEKQGFSIREDGSFVEHAISGWCATPPVVYAEYEGTWEAFSDSLLNIVVDFWGGTRTYQMRIVSLDGDQLGIRYLFTEDRTNAK